MSGRVHCPGEPEPDSGTVPDDLRFCDAPDRDEVLIYHRNVVEIVVNGAHEWTCLLCGETTISARA